ncbi:alpha/beta-hydrolase [Pluteus cervinus]|uniref:Alpha/beta-hydrolase n=1 Tax=Pluteus cervinus TaxID=181527 RepID=A0ACD3B824_9AGAR|nr:alpha/beta-hydrolase [Pluteus cervinus]
MLDIPHPSESVTNTVSGTPHRRTVFYVGGGYVPKGNSTIASGQMYVERLTPAKVTQPYPLLFIHGNGMTGTNFLNTPDGRVGWADFFLGKGYEVYLLDQPSRGRSAWQEGVDGTQSIFDTYTVEARFTATQLYNLWPQASLHTQWPGSGTSGDLIFDQFYAAIMPSLSSDVEVSTKIKAAGSQLLDKIGPVILITHSQSGQFGWILADARPSQVKAILAIEPIGPPFINAVFPPLAPARPYGLTAIPITYSPPISSAQDLDREVISSNSLYTCFKQTTPARKLVNLEEIPVLVITSESGYHAIYDECSVNFLRQAGIKVKHVHLQEVGIHGNGHMMFMEKNNLEIADEVVEPWLEELTRS